MSPVLKPANCAVSLGSTLLPPVVNTSSSLVSPHTSCTVFPHDSALYPTHSTHNQPLHVVHASPATQYSAAPPGSLPGLLTPLIESDVAPSTAYTPHQLVPRPNITAFRGASYSSSRMVSNGAASAPTQTAARELPSISTSKESPPSHMGRTTKHQAPEIFSPASDTPMTSVNGSMFFKQSSHSGSNNNGKYPAIASPTTGNVSLPAFLKNSPETHPRSIPVPVHHENEYSDIGEEGTTAHRHHPSFQNTPLISPLQYSRGGPSSSGMVASPSTSAYPLSTKTPNNNSPLPLAASTSSASTAAQFNRSSLQQTPVRNTAQLFATGGSTGSVGLQVRDSQFITSPYMEQKSFNSTWQSRDDQVSSFTFQHPLMAPPPTRSPLPSNELLESPAGRPAINFNNSLPTHFDLQGGYFNKSSPSPTPAQSPGLPTSTLDPTLPRLDSSFRLAASNTNPSSISR